jgi:queuine tRNA-ribosyltransferase
MFDCIIPTNHARQGIAYNFSGKVKMRRLAHATETRPIDSTCACYVCQHYTRAYLHQLIKCEEPTGWKLISYHNTWFYERLMEEVRKHIEKGSYAQFARNFLNNVEE